MELWVPWIKIGGLALLAIGALILAVRSGRTRSWKAIALSIVNSAVVLFALSASLFLFTAQGCENHGNLIVSPDRRHAARLMIWGSVPSGTSVWVIERRTWSPFWKEVAGGSTIGTLIGPIQPTISWADSSHLIVDFPADAPGDTGYGHTCQNSQVGTVSVVCKTHVENSLVGMD